MDVDGQTRELPSQGVTAGNRMRPKPASLLAAPAVAFATECRMLPLNIVGIRLHKIDCQQGLFSVVFALMPPVVVLNGSST